MPDEVQAVTLRDGTPLFSEEVRGYLRSIPHGHPSNLERLAEVAAGLEALLRREYDGDHETPSPIPTVLGKAIDDVAAMRRSLDHGYHVWWEETLRSRGDSDWLRWRIRDAVNDDRDALPLISTDEMEDVAEVAFQEYREGLETAVSAAVEADAEANRPEEADHAPI